MYEWWDGYMDVAALLAESSKRKGSFQRSEVERLIPILAATRSKKTVETYLAVSLANVEDEAYAAGLARGRKNNKVLLALLCAACTAFGWALYALIHLK